MLQRKVLRSGAPLELMLGLDWAENLLRDKHTSLFWSSVRNGKKVLEIDTELFQQ
jgi:hypothetical protein